MAEVQRKRTLVNPARKKKRRNAKKMSAKQIAIFGTKRQKAALKSSRTRKRKNTARKRHSPRRANAAPRAPRATKRAHRPKRRHRARRRNPGGIVEVALNPATPKRRKSVAKTRKRRRKTNASRRRTHRRRSNPVAAPRRRRRTHAKRTTRRHRRNPSRAVAGGMSNVIVSAAYALGGFVGTKALTQAVLGTSNTGYVGYGANLAFAFVGGKLLTQIPGVSKGAGMAFTLGGIIATLARVLTDMTPLGSTLSRYGLGDYEASTWLSPARYVNAAQSAEVDIPNALRPAIPAGKGMNGMRGLSGTYSRGRSTY